MIEVLIIIWGFINFVAFSMMFEDGFEFGNKENFDLRDKTLLELIGQYLILMPIMVICIIVIIVNWIPFKEK